MDTEAECFSTHIIDGEGDFNEAGVNKFITQVKMRELGVSYAVVAIMGPQSSGKSTLVNHLFRTNFREMNADDGRSQTTLGIWMAKCPGIDPCTIVMDLEGNDGRERGENDTAFEKQIALFALAVSDIVLINMWCSDIGREQASNKPLLRIVFQAMLKLFPPRKTTLMFVIRDKSKTPLEKLGSVLREDTQKIWDAIPKPEAHQQTPLKEFFEIKVEALPHYEHQEKEFKEEVSVLRKKFSKSIERGGLAGDRRGVVDASGFSLSAKKMWQVIKENKDLDLPAHNVMVANIRCEEIANEKCSIFLENKDWLELKNRAESNVVLGFGKKLSSLLDMSLSSYDEEATFFDESGKIAKRKYLTEKLMQLVQPTIKRMWEHITSQTLQKFKDTFSDALEEGQKFEEAAKNCTQKFMTLFDKQCQNIVIEQEAQDLEKISVIFLGNLTSHIAEVRNANLTKLTTEYQSKLEVSIYGPMETLLKGDTNDTWSRIRTLLHRETEDAVSEFSLALSSYYIEEKTEKLMISKLKSYAIRLVERKARDEAAKVLFYVKERYVFIFNHDNDLRTRVWTDKEDIQAINKTARSSCLTLLSVLAAIRLDNEADTILETLFLALGDSETRLTKESTLASNTWDKILVKNTLITPVACLNVWKQLLRETEYTFTQAKSSQENYIKNELERKEQKKQNEQRERERKEQNERIEQERREWKELKKQKEQGDLKQKALNDQNAALKKQNEITERERKELNRQTQRPELGEAVKVVGRAIRNWFDE